ncbi:MAG: translocation/assembly module TamB domain-containing protein, partial [Myxococcales bacterium]|nr:translocation/assembly module TamB domain-containing protein [Myxococcales bacterium]
AGPEDAADGTTVSQRPPWLLSGVDGQVHLRAEAASGFAELAASLSDARGTLLSADAKTGALRYDLLFSSPARAREIARDVPFDALVVVPRRAVEGWPALVRPGPARGDVEARASIRGTLRKPSVALDAAAHGLRLQGASSSPRMEVTCGARYDGEAADASLDVTAGGAGLAHAGIRLKARADDLWGAPVARWPWSASARATLQGWPLGALATLSGQRLRGNVSGNLEVTGLHEDARATADLRISDLRVAGTKYGAGTVTLGLDGHSLRAKLHAGEAPTAVDAEAELAMSWGARLAPSVDPSGPLQASLRASKLRAAALAPLLPASVVDELDGNIDVDARFARVAGRAPELAGSATLSEGVLQLTALGQELRDVRGKLTITPSGVVKLEDVSASGTTGRIHGSGAAELQGLALVAAGAAFTVDRSDALPLDVQGAPVGDVYGQFELRLVPASATRPFTLLDLSVPALHLKMPETSTRALQELGEAPPEEHVGVFTAPGRFTRLPMSGAERRPPATPEDTRSGIRVAVHLGRDVDLSRGTDLRVSLEGDVTATLQQKTTLEGQLRLRSGKLDVQGKSFEIESGTITFTGDPTNPLVKVTASWTAADGTKVFADYLGPLKTGKVTLRSEPPRPQNEILALIVFGTADGSQATPYTSTAAPPSAATQAGTTVGGFAAQGLNQGIAKLTGLDLTAKVDTSQGNPKPEVALQIAKSISLQIAFVLGQPPPGTNQDTTYATIDWRFFRNWSLQTTFGNLGSSIADIVWQRRY